MSRVFKGIQVENFLDSCVDFRSMSSIEILEEENKLFLYGGFDDEDTLDGNIYILDLLENQWQIVNSRIIRESHTTNYIGNGEFFIFGGVPTESDSLNTHFVGEDGDEEEDLQNKNFISFNIYTNEWKLLDWPDSRLFGKHASCLNSDRSKLYISGGLNRNINSFELFDDLLCYDIKSHKWEEPRKFIKRFNHHIIYHNDKIWSFGGLDINMNYFDSSEIHYYDLRTNTTGRIEINHNSSKQIGDHIYLTLPFNSCLKSSNRLISPKFLDIIFPLLKNDEFKTEFDHKQAPSVNLIDVQNLRLQKMNYIKGHESVLQKFIIRYTFIYNNQLCLLGNDQATSCKSLNKMVKIELSQLGFDNLVNERKSNLWKLNELIDEHEIIIDSENANLSNMMFDFASIFQKQEFTDFEVYANDSKEPIRVHQAILISRWPFFKQVIKTQMNEYKEKKIIFDEKHCLLKIILQFIYSGLLIMPKDYKRNTELATGILKLSHYFELSELFRKVYNLFLHDFSNYSIASCLWIYRELYHIDDCYLIVKKVVDFLFKNWGSVVRSDEFMQMKKVDMLNLLQEINVNGIVINDIDDISENYINFNKTKDRVTGKYYGSEYGNNNSAFSVRYNGKLLINGNYNGIYKNGKFDIDAGDNSDTPIEEREGSDYSFFDSSVSEDEAMSE